MSDFENPRPQVLPNRLTEIFAEVAAMNLQSILKEADVPFKKINTVLDLYCGAGINVAGALVAFPNATIHAIDYYPSVLDPYVSKNKRVKFHQGFVTNVLQSSKFPQGDIVILSYSSKSNGLNEQTIHTIRDKTKGLLITTGDNNGIETKSWFRKMFTLQYCLMDKDATVWS